MERARALRQNQGHRGGHHGQEGDGGECLRPMRPSGSHDARRQSAARASSRRRR
jgi:hypothetical protein